ncbi:carboxypeptidase regulatory-like domain-containing protein [Catenovulum maritimum]|uniref:carboxypeptidase regulatory-like domain-containing protein n=1 Tax=Catenovulum maritimum TaxID=1513271 RepID=UPI00069FE2AE|nr:carboxypeptidase regulatory-like domain-containing protein [Catenovulum maritimum]
MLCGKNYQRWLQGCLLVTTLLLPACSKNDNDPESSTNQSPSVSITGNAQVTEGDSLTLQANALDTDGTISSYQWSLQSGSGVTLGANTASSLIINTEDITADTDVIVSVTVTDNNGATASDSHSFTVKRITSSLTLMGMVTDQPLPNALVKITIGTDTFEVQTGSDGSYSILLEVDQANVNKLVKLVAEGNPTTHPGVVFVSQLPAFNTLSTQAGEDGILTEEENFSINITNVTTAEAALLQRANQGEDVTTETQLNQLLSQQNVTDKLKLSALIKLVVDDANYDLPNGVADTLVLVVDSVNQQNFEAFVNSQDANLLTATIEVIVQDENLVKIGGENQDFDNDGVLDVVDAFPFDPNESVDTDMDGKGNNADTDDDNDQVADVDDAFPLDPNESIDTDMDGTGNNADTDDDNDQVADVDDAFPLDPNESVDTDMDGTGNNADTDDDNDQVADVDDAFPLDANESVDTDMDGTGNNADTDDDNDQIADVVDAFPLDPNESVDTDMDGTGNNADTDDDNDQVADVDDAFPLDPNESIDTDMDGTGNNADTDDDNDQVADVDDAFPLDPNESVDTDMDGTGNNADTDDDNDQVADVDDAFPLDPNESVDTDMDGTGNNADTDDDNDQVADVDDAFPLDPNESIDTDMDGTGNNADTDDDNDQIADVNDAYPLISIGDLVDTDKDGIPDDCDQACIDLGMMADEDDDGNGIPDVDEVDQVAVQILTPESLITVGTSPITVAGSVSSDATISLNGVNITNDNGNFSGEVALKEGSNTIEARAVRGTQIQTDTISVSLDKTPPYLTIDSHQDQQTVYTSSITVTGLVNDIVRGTIEESQANVTVNGTAASIQNRSYSATNISLQEGTNTITVSGADQVGNTSSVEIDLVYQVLLGKRIELESGDGQDAIINNTLNDPLVVQVLDDNNEPVQDAAVVFRVAQGSGAVAVGTENQGRAVVVDSDENGMASTQFKLGARTGVNNHKVTAAVVGYTGNVTFSASANGQIGNKLSVNSGNNQRGAVGNILPEALVVVVTDSGANVVSNARVKFVVTKGNGVFSTNSTTTVEKLTDSDGRASVAYKLGTLTGIDAQRITATLIDAPEGQVITAGFSATAFVPADPGQTTITGVVLDNQETPIPNVTIRVEDSTREAVTNENGRFVITQAPVGPVHLIADGSTTTVEGEFPSLGYNLVTVAGVANPLSAPIYMVKLDTENAVYAGNEDVSLTLDEFPGFKLDIKKDSVTFPDGSRQGLISVTPVNAGTVPMAPPNGMQPQFIVTIQPTGTKFDPPAKLTLPNVDAHQAGAQVEMYSFDHDLEEFVAVGLGTVSEDGTVVVSNPGVGVIKAGWHCGSQPGGQSCAHNCPICQDCDGECNCVPAEGDPRLAGMDQEGDCKKPECQEGSLARVNDDADVPEDEETGDCKSPACENGTVTEVVDNSDESLCTTCGENGPEPKPDGHVPPEDKCIVCEDGKETKKPDNEISSTSITFNGVKNFIADVNKVLDFLGADRKIPEIALSLSNSVKEVCCTQLNGEMTREEKDEGTVIFPRWSYAWTPTIPPWSGDYTFEVLGRSIGIAYGVRFEVGFDGKFSINRTKRECQGDNCWGGEVKGDLGVGGGPFGSVPNPGSSPTECGPPNDKRPCDIIRIEGKIKTGINIQAGVNCEKVTGGIGHNGVSAEATIIVAEGSWVETGGSTSIQLVNSGSIATIDIPLPN